MHLWETVLIQLTWFPLFKSFTWGFILLVGSWPSSSRIALAFWARIPQNPYFPSFASFVEELSQRNDPYMDKIKPHGQSLIDYNWPDYLKPTEVESIRIWRHKILTTVRVVN